MLIALARQRNWLFLAVLIAVATAFGAHHAPKSKSVFSMLKVGQAVSLRDEGAAYSISFFEDEVPLSHTVIEVADDFVVVRDISGLKETVVPVYAVKSVGKVWVKVE